MRETKINAAIRQAFPPNGLTHLAKLTGHTFVRRNDVVEGVRDLALESHAVAGQPHAEVAPAHGLEGEQQVAEGLVGRRYAGGKRRDHVADAVRAHEYLERGMKDAKRTMRRRHHRLERRGEPKKHRRRLTLQVKS
jgi:hypothetical protein